MRNGQTRTKSPALRAATLLASGLLLSACGGGGGGSGAGTGTSTVSGTAATGAAMAGAAISLSCGSGLTRTATADAVGFWSTTVPTPNLPCAVRASDGSDTLYSFTIGNSGSIVTNITPLTTLALAQILAAAPDSRFASLSATDLDRLTDAAINATIGALNTALAGYALPAGFNPVTTLLAAAAAGQAGNDHDRLLDQFGAANPGLDALITSAATGTMPTLATPGHTPGATSLAAFFTTFAGDYTLTVTSAVGEGTTNAAVQALLPQGSARVVHIKANGDVVIDAEGKSITVTGANYPSNLADTSQAPAWSEFSGSATTLNVVNYRTNNGSKVPGLYLTYDPDTGKLEVSPTGFVDTGKGYTEGYAKLTGTIFVPPPTPPATTCTVADDKLAFTGAPPDFCGFTRAESEGHPSHNLYYQFRSTAGGHGTTYVTFNLNGDDTFRSIDITNNNYSYSCGDTVSPATICAGATLLRKANSTEFLLQNVTLNGIGNTTGSLTASGLLIHPAGSTSDGNSTVPTLASFAPATGAVGDAVTLTGTGFSTTPANNVVRFTSDTATGIQATVVSGSATQLVVKVPAGARTGPLTVFNGHAVASSGGDFVVGGGSSNSNTLAATISAPFAGTYKLSCYSNGSSSTLVERTVVVNADGTSTLDGEPVIASGHGGSVSYTHRFGNNRYSLYGAKHSTSVSSDGTSFELRHKHDGSFVTDNNRSHSAYVDSKGGTCTGISGPARSATTLDKTELATLVGTHALSDTVTCTRDGSTHTTPSGATTVGIDSDGTARFGGFSLAPAQYTIDDAVSFKISDAISFPPPTSGLLAMPAVKEFTLSGDINNGSGSNARGSIFIRFDKDKQIASPTIISLQSGHRSTCQP